MLALSTASAVLKSSNYGMAVAENHVISEAKNQFPIIARSSLSIIQINVDFNLLAQDLPQAKQVD